MTLLGTALTCRSAVDVDGFSTRTRLNRWIMTGTEQFCSLRSCNSLSRRFIARSGKSSSIKWASARPTSASREGLRTRMRRRAALASFRAHSLGYLVSSGSIIQRQLFSPSELGNPLMCLGSLQPDPKVEKKSRSKEGPVDFGFLEMGRNKTRRSKGDGEVLFHHNSDLEKRPSRKKLYSSMYYSTGVSSDGMYRHTISKHSDSESDFKAGETQPMIDSDGDMEMRQADGTMIKIPYHVPTGSLSFSDPFVLDTPDHLLLPQMTQTGKLSVRPHLNPSDACCFKGTRRRQVSCWTTPVRRSRMSSALPAFLLLS